MLRDVMKNVDNIQEHMGNVSGEMETKNPNDILEIKYSVKNASDLSID